MAEQQTWLAHEVTPSGEEWRAIPDFPGYEASDQGRVRSFMRPWRNGPRIMKQQIQWNGYRNVLLTSPDGGKRHRLVQRLILGTFSSSPGEEYQADHLNGDKTDNRIANLEWVTSQENHLRRTKRTGRMRTFECPNCSTPLYLAQNKMALQIDTRAGK